MKVAIAVGALNGRCGPSVNGLRLARSLIARDVDVQIVHQSGGGDPAQEIAGEFAGRHVELRAVHPLDPRLAVGLSRYLRSNRPDVLHLNLPTHVLQLAPVARLHGVPTVYTMRNLLEYNAPWIRSALRSVGPLAVSRFVGVSSAIEENIRRHRLTKSEIRVIYNGVEGVTAEQLIAWRQQTRKALGVSPDELVVGTCGRLSADKQPHHLLEAVRLLGNREFRMVVVGDGQMRPSMEDFCKARGLGNVSFVGWQHEVYPFLAAMDIFAFHSMPYSEGLPTVVTEAAMVGLPLVLADIACLREIYLDEEQALFAKPAQPQAFAAQIARLLDSPQLRRDLGKEVKKLAMRYFSIDAMADRYLKLYAELAT